MALLSSMPLTVGQVSLVNARTQGNLKADVSDKKLFIMEKGKEKREVLMDDVRGTILARK